MRFTKEQAIIICERRLHRDKYHECYYQEMKNRCELHGGYCEGTCVNYVPDITFTNFIRYNILNNPERVKENWERLCQTDKELFIAIHGEGVL